MTNEYWQRDSIKRQQLENMRLGHRRLNNYRSAKLLTDGRTALAMRARGARPADMLAAIGGSRPRMYKAIRIALDTDGWKHQSVDPLLS